MKVQKAKEVKENLLSTFEKIKEEEYHNSELLSLVYETLSELCKPISTLKMGYGPTKLFRAEKKELIDAYDSLREFSNRMEGDEHASDTLIRKSERKLKQKTYNI